MPQLLDEESLGEPPTEHELFTVPVSAVPIAQKLKGSYRYELVKTWFEYCLKHHGDTCRQYLPPHNSDAMIRLCDVEEMKLVGATLHAEYIALSYVWGQTTEPVLVKSTEVTLFP